MGLYRKRVNIKIFDPQFLELAQDYVSWIADSKDDYTVLGWRIWFDERPEHNKAPWRIQHDVRINAPFSKVPVGSILRITTPFGFPSSYDAPTPINWDEISWDDPRHLAPFDDATRFVAVNNMEDIICESPGFENNDRIFYTEAEYLHSYPPEGFTQTYLD